MYFKNLARQLLASSAFVSLVVATPLAKLETRHDQKPIKPKVFLIDMVSFHNNRESRAEICSHPVRSSPQRLKSGTGSRSSIFSQRISPFLASRPSFRTFTALPITMFVSL